MLDTSNIKDKISTLHEGDEKQLEVIFSDSPRLIVEAPAGYGKTTTMISRIAYLYAIGSVPNPKRILGLTFSVNAALKVKREVAEKLPALLGSPNSPIVLSERVAVTNYHGFCKGVLKKYGYLIADALRKDVNLFKAVGASDIEKRADLNTILSVTEKQIVESMEAAIKVSTVPDSQSIHSYNEIVIRKLLPAEYVTHNAVILFVLEIFERFPEVLKFYQSYYPLVVVDEFQDTNCIAWSLLQSLIAAETQLVFLGDPLQRIYGFIGALPNIMNVAARQYGMTQVVLEKNYRFRHNPEMLKLDTNVRANAAALFRPTIPEVAQLPALGANKQEEEATKILGKVQEILAYGNDRVAILCRARGKNAEIIEEQFSQNDVPYFYGMFTDDDEEYIEFHNKCQELFIKRFGKTKGVAKKSLIAFSENVKQAYSETSNKTTNSLLKLIDALVEKVSVDYSDLVSEDKYSFMIDIFENRQLKQTMEYVDSPVILSTIHGAKGLEWDYVVLSDVEQWAFSSGSCRKCTSPTKNANDTSCCKLPKTIPADMTNQILDDLCVFYVGLTRARKQVYISASKERFNSQRERYTNGKICCLATIDGVKLVNAGNYDNQGVQIDGE